MFRMTECFDKIYELQHCVAQSQHGRRGWGWMTVYCWAHGEKSCVCLPGLRTAKSLEIVCNEHYENWLSQKVCWVFPSKSTCKAGTQKKFSLLPGTLDVSQFPGQMVENCWHFCLLVENNLLANQCILAARPGFMSRKKTQIIGQPVTLGLAGFHYSVLHSGT